MYYSAIGMIAIVLLLIMNHEVFKIDKNRDEVKKAFRMGIPPSYTHLQSTRTLPLEKRLLRLRTPRQRG